MKGTFKVIDGKPFVETKKSKTNLKLINVNQCKTYNITSKDYQVRDVWIIVPFNDNDFWNEKKPVPSLYEGQKIKVEQIKDENAKVVKLDY